MKRARAGAGAGLAAMAALLVSCERLSPSVPATNAPTAAGASTAENAAVPQVSAAANATTAELGIQIYWHEVNDEHAVRSNAGRLFDYSIGLGANSVGISFPIYTDGVRPTRVYSKDQVTPTPDSLKLVIAEAKRRSLRVMLRPLIDEQNIKDRDGNWRGSIEPRNVAAWFASYRDMLRPYLVAAQVARADTFVLGAELDSLVGKSEHWQELQNAAAAVFTGRLAYADNWGEWVTGRPGVDGVEAGLDAYPRLRVTDSSSVAQIAAAWTAWLQRRRADVLARTVVQEVGIVATAGAYREPAAWAKPGQGVDPQIQANWFAGACDAIRGLQMPGIYFWNLDAWADPAKAESYTAGSFIGRGDSAIKACFAQGWPGQ